MVNIHRSITNRLTSSPLPDIEEGDICCLNSSLVFLSRLLFPLVLGAQVIAIGDDQLKDMTHLAHALETHKISSVFFVPGILRQLLSLNPARISRLHNLRTVTVGGEALTPELVKRFRDLLPQTRLINIYGGSEVGTTAAMRVMSDDAAPGRGSIGWPTANTRVYLLDGNLDPVPVGMVGEIYIGAPHLARGYLYRPDLTAERFVADPFGLSAGGRLYRTGDLGRHRTSGELEFVGRADNQVKIRGYRVEVEEVEAALEDDQEVHQAAVTVHKLDGAERLVAYVVGKEDAAVTASQLRDHLRRRVPNYMLPSNFIFLDCLPRLPNGKIDRHALPQPEGVRPEISGFHEPPRSPLEESIAKIWARVMGLPSIGIHDHFLELGGDSMIAMQIALQVGDPLGLEVPVHLLFDKPTVAEFTTAVAEALSIGSQNGAHFREAAETA